ncbi:MAG TPA: oligogalacturonate lyase family protein [Capsulimonadaceae bacterium]|jgi:hypothetical protein
MEPIRVTDHPTANDQLLYFTSTSLLPDGRIVVISDDTGDPNLVLIDPRTGERRLLTDNRDGMLHSYVYFSGHLYRGFGKASVSLHPASGNIYYIQGREIRVVDANGGVRVLAEYPDGQVTAFTHVSSDGSRLCVPTTDARALDGYTGQYNIDERVQAENLSSYLRVYDTATGAELLAECIPRAWITHVQFDPRDSGTILYNHEWPSDCGIRRMWLYRNGTITQLRKEGDGRSREDWACHEMWERDGSAIIYHGSYANGPAYIGRIDPITQAMREIALPAHWKQYGHFTVGKPGVMVSDGYYIQHGDEAASGCGEWISLLNVDWNAGSIEWTPLCRSGSSWDSQDSHPHPILSADDSAAYFTSDVSGRRAVYRVPTRQ